MKIYEETNIRDFKFWSGGEDRASQLTDEDWDTVEPELEMLYPDGMSDGELNDLFWFEFDMIVQMLGYKNEADFDRKRDPKYIDDNDLKEYIIPFFRSFIKDASYGGKREWIFQLADLLGYDYTEFALEDDEEGYFDAEYHAAYDYLLSLDDEEQLYDELFDSNQANYELDGEFPTWEEFREMQMDKQ